MRDNYGRSINYLRVSVTDRCNFRCVYCLPRQGVRWLDHAEVLSYEELLRLVRIFCGEGITKVRLTGGEPLVRKDITDFVAALAALGKIDDLSMTTNGSLLPPMAPSLKAAGLDRVNISLDTADPDHFRQITTCGRLEDTLAGIGSALAAGLTPVKINVVLTGAFRESDLAYFIEQVRCFPVAVRFIEQMPFGCGGDSSPDCGQVKNMLTAAGVGALELITPEGVSGPAKYYRFPGAKGCFGFITPLSDHFCGACNRLRLTADGRLKPCLLSNREIDVKTPLRSGAGDSVLAGLFHQAVNEKPPGHCLDNTGCFCGFNRGMSQIGG